MILQCYLDDETHAELLRVAAETGRSVEDLADAAIAEAAIASKRERPLERAA